VRGRPGPRCHGLPSGSSAARSPPAAAAGPFDTSGLGVAPGLLIAQGIKRYAQHRLSDGVRRVVRGAGPYRHRPGHPYRRHRATPRPLSQRPGSTGAPPEVAKGRALAREVRTLNAGMSRVGCAYHFCGYPDSLRPPAPAEAPRRWQERTPAMAAGLTDHRWTMSEWLHFQVPPPPWVPALRRRRRPHKAPPSAQAQPA
jgi:hypothetical protein